MVCTYNLHCNMRNAMLDEDATWRPKILENFMDFPFCG